MQLRSRNDDDDDDDEEEEEEETPQTIFRAGKAKASAVGGAQEDGEDEDDRPRGLLAGIERNNPNLVKKQEKQVKVKDLAGAVDEMTLNPEATLSRREREQLEAQRKVQ